MNARPSGYEPCCSPRSFDFWQNSGKKIGVLRPSKFPEANFLKSRSEGLAAGAVARRKFHRRKAFAFNPFVSLKRQVGDFGSYACSSNAGELVFDVFGVLARIASWLRGLIVSVRKFPFPEFDPD